jgi:hypothetical protein
MGTALQAQQMMLWHITLQLDMERGASASRGCSILQGSILMTVKIS